MDDEKRHEELILELQRVGYQIQDLRRDRLENSEKHLKELIVELEKIDHHIDNAARYIRITGYTITFWMVIIVFYTFYISPRWPFERWW